MATIDPTLLGEQDVAQKLPDEVGERGPGWVDSPTATTLIQRVNAGLLALPDGVEEAIAPLGQDQLDELFAKHLAASPLTSNQAIEHRVFALASALVEVTRRVGAGRDAVTGQPAPQPRQELDYAVLHTQEYHDQLQRDLIAIGLTPGAALEVAQLVPISAKRLGEITGFEPSTLAAWRSLGRGPRFVKASPGNPMARRVMVAYPLGEVITFLYREAQR